MKLSSRGRYGVRLMLDLAFYYGGEAQFLKDIAKRQEISEKYLWQLIKPLKSAKLINSARGAHGGYKLAKHPSEITLRDIVEILEGPISITECSSNPDVCERIKICSARDIWENISVMISQYLESISLADLKERQKGKYMYDGI